MLRSLAGSSNGEDLSASTAERLRIESRLQGTRGRVKSPVRTNIAWHLRTRTLELGTRTLVMGVVNITPDSFSDGGLFPRRGSGGGPLPAMLDEGADLLDLGAESTRPGSRAGGTRTRPMRRR